MLRLRSLLLAILVVLLWGTSFVLTKIALTELGPFTIAFYRWLLAALALLIILFLQKRIPEMFAALSGNLRQFALLGFVGITAFYSLQNLALEFTTAVNLGLIINLAPVFTALLALWWLRERISLVAVIGMAVAFLGTILVGTAGGGPTFGVQHIIGDLLTVAAALCAAVYTVYGKKVVAQHRPEVVTTTAALVGAIILLPLAAIEGLVLPKSTAVWVSVAVLGIGAGALANTYWWALLDRMDASRASVFLQLIPVVSTLTAVIGLGETLTFQVAAGGVMVLLGLALSQRN